MRAVSGSSARPVRPPRSAFGVGRNRLFRDVTPTDQAAEMARLEGLGATRLDVELGDPRWVVMADLEGNDSCVLHEYGQLPAQRTPMPQ